jgi:hypothetical protein
MSTEASRVAFLGPKISYSHIVLLLFPQVSRSFLPCLMHPSNMRKAFATVLRQRADALLVGGSPVSYTQLRRTMKFAADNSLPAIYPIAKRPRPVALLLGSNTEGRFRQAARLWARRMSPPKRAPRSSCAKRRWNWRATT